MFYLIFLIWISFVSSSVYAKEVKQNDVVASVGEYKISYSQFSKRYSDYLTSTGIKDNMVIRRSILNNMVNELLLRYYDDNSEIFNNPEYNREINWAKKQTVLAFLKDREIYAKIEVGEGELREAFKQMNEKLELRHLYANTEEEAEKLYERLLNGEDFNSLAKEVFTDSTLKNNGGYLGYFSWGDLDPNFETVAYLLKTGEISRPVKTAQGWSIIKLENKIQNPIVTEQEFIKNKSKIARLLKIRKKQNAEDNYLNKFFNSEKRRFNQKSLEMVFASFDPNSLNFSENKAINLTEQPLVTYNSLTFSASEIVKQLNEIPSYHLNKIKDIDKLQTVITGLLIQKILLDQAVRLGYDKDPEVIDTYSKLENNVFLKYKRLEVWEKTSVNDSALISFYKENISHFTEEPEINIREILVDKEELANEILTRLSSGENFNLLAKNYSVRKWSAENGGEIGFAPVSKFGSLKDTLWNSKLGSILGPIKILNQYGIFQVIGKKEKQVKSFESVRTEVEALYKKENSASIMKKYLSKIMNRVPINYNDSLIGSFKLSSDKL